MTSSKIGVGRVVAWVLVAGGALACCGAGPATKAARFTGAALPEAPMQKVAWGRPQTTLPEALVRAVQLLFDQGVADPRGCEYRRVEVSVGSVWSGDGGTVATRGWVLPAGPGGGGGQRFVVCWNGLVYPAALVGEKADLAADVGTMLAADRAARAAHEEERPDSSYRRGFGAMPEAGAVSHETMTALKVCMLLRAGETALAERYWAELRPELPGPHGDRYLLLAEDWAWYAFDRAVCAHMRADDGIALATARLLAAARPRIEASAAELKFQRPHGLGPRDEQRAPVPYILFLQPLDVLLADQERRAKGADRPLPLIEAEQIADKPKRVAALVRSLEDVAARQWGQPGRVSLSEDPIVRALEKEGADAVEPLLDCLERDDRLTRSVGFGRDFHTGRHLIGVSQAAFEAVSNILQVRELVPSGADRMAAARAVRAAWERTKGKPVAERWYEILADDNAEPKQWLEAAERIVRPADVEVRGGWISEPSRRPGEAPPGMKGEELRVRRNPSVSELMARRVPQIAGAEKHSSAMIFNAADATRLALALGKWDARAALPVLRAQIEDCKAKLEFWQKHGSSALGSLEENISALSAALARAGGEGALKAYAEWVRTRSPDGGRDDFAKLFAPLWENPEDPDVRAAARWLFTDPASPWRCLARLRGSFRPGGDLLASPMIAVEGFRDGIVANLADRSRVGTVMVAGGQTSVKMDSGGQIGFGFADEADPLAPKAGEERVVRVCDWYAWRLSGLEGSPAFELYWPEEKRDAAAREYAAFVREWGACFRFNPMQRSFFHPPFDAARMTFPRRDRPATAAEARAKSAIFSLDEGGGGQVRVVALDAFPARARWTTFTGGVKRMQTYDPETKRQKIVTEYDRDGWVWQAEEVLEGGEWLRYYGFVGRHVVAKVPAAEIELVKDPAGPRPAR